MLTNTIVNYKGIPIEYDDLGFWTIQVCTDDLVFYDLSDAYDYVDNELI